MTTEERIEKNIQEIKNETIFNPAFRSGCIFLVLAGLFVYLFRDLLSFYFFIIIPMGVIFIIIKLIVFLSSTLLLGRPSRLDKIAAPEYDALKQVVTHWDEVEEETKREEEKQRKEEPVSKSKRQHKDKAPNSDAVEALRSLGYNKTESSLAVMRAIKQHPSAPLEEIITAALQSLRKDK